MDKFNNNNRLLASYQNYQQSNNIQNRFQNNPLLNNNQMFQSNMNYNNSQQSQQMQMMYMANMQRQKELQKIKHIEKLNELENKVDKNKIRESVIKPVKLERKNNVNDIVDHIKKDWGISISNKNNNGNRYKNISNQFKSKSDSQKKNFWNKRTNQPYKNIITDKKYINPFINKKKIKENELIVHKVSKLDKEGVDNEFEDLQNNIEKHDKELKVIYSTTKEAEHKKKFNYNHKYKYRVSYTPSNHNKLKKDKIEFYKKEQKKAEQGKDKVDTIIASLVDDGILEENEIEELKKIPDLPNQSNKTQTGGKQIIKPINNTNKEKTIPTKRISKPIVNHSKVTRQPNIKKQNNTTTKRQLSRTTTNQANCRVLPNGNKVCNSKANRPNKRQPNKTKVNKFGNIKKDDDNIIV